MAYTVVLPLPLYCGVEAAACTSRSFHPLSLLLQASITPFETSSSQAPQYTSPQKNCASLPRADDQGSRGDALVRRRTPARRGVQARNRTLSPQQRPRNSHIAETELRIQLPGSSAFSTSTPTSGSSANDYPPVTLATPSQATYDLLKKWHRSISSTTTRNEEHVHCTVKIPPSEPLVKQNSSKTSFSITDSTGEKSATAASLPSGEPTTPPPDRDTSHIDTPTSDINALMRHPALFDNIRAPRYPIVLCHGLYGFDVRGPFLGLEIHYWAAALEILRNKIGAEVIVRGVPGTGSIPSRAKALHDYLCSDEADVKGAKLNFVGHSMGGLDARYLISHLKPKPDEYIPVSVTTISTPHRGSPFMDWCNANVGIGNEYVEEAIREVEEKSGELGGDGALRGEGKRVADGAEKLPYSLKNPLFVRPKKNTNGDTEKAGDAEISKKAVQQFEEEKKAESPHKALSPSGENGVKEQVVDALQDIADKITPDNTKAGLSSSSPFKSLTSLGFVSPLTRALSSFGGLFSSYMLSVFDQPAYAMLSTRYMAKVFNPSTPDSPHVSYFSIAARIPKMPLWHPLWLPKVILDVAAESRTAGAERDGSAAALGKADQQGNDGLVSISSAKWGQFLGVVEDKDHWDLRGSGAPRWGVSDKINPATGKPFRNAAAASKQATLEKRAADQQQTLNTSKTEKDEDGWLMINRMLGTLLGSRASDCKAKQPPNGTNDNSKASINLSESDGPSSVASKASETAKAFLENYATLTVLDEGPSGSPLRAIGPGKDGNESGLVNEVASWISDRLPQGSEERRKLAGEVTRRQQTEASKFEQLDGSDPASMDFTLGSPPTLNAAPAGPVITPQATESSLHKDGAPGSTSGWNATTSLAVVTKEQGQMLKLQREADWLEITGRADDARELRRELEWHREECKKRLGETSTAEELEGVDIGPEPGSAMMMALDKDEKLREATAESARGSDEEKRRKRDRSEKEELERFWIALCQHLYAHGY